VASARSTWLIVLFRFPWESERALTRLGALAPTDPPEDAPIGDEKEGRRRRHASLQRSFNMFALFSTLLVLLPAAFSYCLHPSEAPNNLECVFDSKARTAADPEDCARYYECYNGCISRLTCGSGKLYESETGWCRQASTVSLSTS